MSKMAKEFAEKYLKEELDSRLKHLGGQPDALCQAYQTALDAIQEICRISQQAKKGAAAGCSRITT